MSGLSIVSSRPARQPMIDTSARYRIVHAENSQWYWLTSGMWGLKAAAAIYTERERGVKALPNRGCWEIVAATPVEEPSTVRKPLERSLVALTITKYLWTQHCHEEGLKVVPRLEDVPLKESERFIKAGEFITDLTLSPDRFDTAILAMADVLCTDSSGGSLCIFTTSPRAKKHFYHLAISMLNALQAYVRDVPPDSHYRDQLCRELDAIVPKGQQS